MSGPGTRSGRLILNKSPLLVSIVIYEQDSLRTCSRTVISELPKGVLLHGPSVVEMLTLALLGSFL